MRKEALIIVLLVVGCDRFKKDDPAAEPDAAVAAATTSAPAATSAAPSAAPTATTTVHVTTPVGTVHVATADAGGATVTVPGVGAIPVATKGGSETCAGGKTCNL